MKLGFIGFGEVGFEQSVGFKQEGIQEIMAFDVMQNDSKYGPFIQERMEKSGVTLASGPDAVFDFAEIVFVAVPGKVALETAKNLVPFLKASTIYVDVSASAPAVKQAVWECISPSGASFVDGAMMGSLPLFKHKVPTLISGNGSDKLLQELAPYHVDMEKISEKPGEATAVKFVRSIFMKGLPSLMLEVLQAASLLQVEDTVLKSLAKTMDACPFEESFNRLVTGTAIHAERRAHEVKEVIEMLESIGVEPTMSRATYKKHCWIADKNMKETFGGKTPREWQAVVAAWKE